MSFKNQVRLSAIRSLIHTARVANHALVKAKRLKWYGAEDTARAKRGAIMAEARELHSHIR